MSVPTVYRRNYFGEWGALWQCQWCTEIMAWLMGSIISVPTVFRRKCLVNKEQSTSSKCVQKGRFGYREALFQCQLCNKGKVWWRRGTLNVYKSVQKGEFGEWGSICQCQLWTEGEVWWMRSTLPVPNVYRRGGLVNEEHSACANCVQKGRFGEWGALLEYQLRTECEFWWIRSTLPVPTRYIRGGLVNEEHSACANCL